jgi:hypothetical protein
MKRSKLAGFGWAYRAWYYFRMGYSTYLTFLLGYVSTLITVYYLAVKNMPPLLDLFPHFAEFAIIATVVGVPLAVLIGWVHLKRSRAFSSEADIGVEANPYYYKWPPGYWMEVIGPVYLEMLAELKRLLEANKLLAADEKSRIEDLERKLKTLNEGGYVGTPRTKL